MSEKFDSFEVFEYFSRKIKKFEEETALFEIKSYQENKNERLLVNGEDAEVWRDVFAATLTDGRNDESSTIEENNTYKL